MTGNDDRMARAGAYVLGLLDDHARERAERDMLTDPEFLACVARFASQVRPPAHAAPEAWEAVARHITELPQMKGMKEGAVAPAPGALLPGDGAKAHAGNLRAVGTSPSALGGARGSILAASLLVALCIGYAGGLLTAPAAGACATSIQAAAVSPAR